mmetsp:Transcript_67922/g.192466  ORF Transcript_67922/g.192466 Transcript_67922/m.192466 type:complete len:202 (-) Transcript_67922:432-1037(-)
MVPVGRALDRRDDAVDDDADILVPGLRDVNLAPVQHQAPGEVQRRLRGVATVAGVVSPAAIPARDAVSLLSLLFPAPDAVGEVHALISEARNDYVAVVGHIHGLDVEAVLVKHVRHENLVERCLPLRDLEPHDAAGGADPRAAEVQGVEQTALAVRHSHGDVHLTAGAHRNRLRQAELAPLRVTFRQQLAELPLLPQVPGP